jgi:hypothetical protein
LFYEEKKRPLLSQLLKRKLMAEITWGTTGKEIYFWMKLRELLARMRESDRRRQAIAEAAPILEAFASGGA